MRAIVVRRFGGPEVLAPAEAADPAPPAGAVRIRVAMAGVIFTDTERRRGLNAEVRLPWIPGTEAAGIVDSVADDVDTGLVGRRVAVGHLARAPRASRGRARARRVPTEAKAALVRALGADAAFVTEHALAGVRGLTDGRGVDVVLDSVGRETRALSLAALAPFGRLVCFGNASGAPAPFDPEELYDRSLQVGAYWLRTPHAPEVRARAVADLLSGIADGSLPVPPTTVLPLAEAAAAHRALESRASRGKLLLRVSSP